LSLANARDKETLSLAVARDKETLSLAVARDNSIYIFFNNISKQHA